LTIHVVTPAPLSRWFYADKHNVQLPDEYDQIYHSLEPFWGIKPADLRALQAEWEEHEDTFTIGKKDGTITLLSTTITKESNYHVTLLNNAYQFINLLKPVQHFLPPFRAIFSPHDNPNLHTDWELKKSALDAAASGSCALSDHEGYAPHISFAQILISTIHLPRISTAGFRHAHPTHPHNARQMRTPKPQHSRRRGPPPTRSAPRRSSTTTA
jgi:hypothetical protein